jgi:vancomycin permeability regulator SanA
LSRRPSSGVRGARVLVAIGFAALLFVGSSNGWVAASTRALTYQAADSVPEREVAIVPGTFAAQGRPGPMLRARLEAALAAYTAGRVRAILVSGNESAGEVTAMREWLAQSGVDDEHILVDPAGTRTLQTMRNAAQRFGVSRAVVCTQTVSMPRALFLARSAGIDAVGLAIPTTLERSPRWIAMEALKGALAILETFVLVLT